MDNMTRWLGNAPAPSRIADTWARLCCEQAIHALDAGCYPVGAVIVNDKDELVVSGCNKVFDDTGLYQSRRHAEMEVIDQLEREFPDQARSNLTLFVSLEPCLMCFGRILLSGIRRVRYLTKDPIGGFTRGFHLLPPVWSELHQQASFDEACVSDFWQNLAKELVNDNADDMRTRIAAAWNKQSVDG